MPLIVAGSRISAVALSDLLDRLADSATPGCRSNEIVTDGKLAEVVDRERADVGRQRRHALSGTSAPLFERT